MSADVELLRRLGNYREIFSRMMAETISTFEFSKDLSEDQKGILMMMGTSISMARDYAEKLSDSLRG